MKILLASTPIPGHINAVLPVARMLAQRDHDVRFITASVHKDRVEATGAQFIPFQGRANIDLSDINRAFPARLHMMGLDMLRYTWERVFFDPVPDQCATLREALAAFDADIIIAESFCFGTLPLLLDRHRKRPPVMHYGVSYLQYRRDDGAPLHAGYPPARDETERALYRQRAAEVDARLTGPACRYLNARLAQAGAPPLYMNPFDAAITLPDIYAQATVPQFEYPRRELPPSVRFVGTLDHDNVGGALPDWAYEVDGSRHVVLVTQGTVANADLGQLIAPTLAALADETDVLVVATTGTRSVHELPGPIPANARVVSYIPFDWLLPKVDVVVSNGGYGTVTQALKHGVPLVVAGLTEDKAEVSARVAWSGTGIDLRTNSPSVAALKASIRAVLEQPDYRTAACRMAQSFARVDTRETLLRLVQEATGQPA
jgi:MGT family glycosyltransferase